MDPYSSPCVTHYSSLHFFFALLDSRSQAAGGFR